MASEGDGCLLAWPHGLAASSFGLFATDRVAKAIFEVVLPSAAKGIASRIAAFEHEIGDISAHGDDMLAVATDNSIVVLNRSTSWAKVVLTTRNVRWRGVSISACGSEIVAVAQEIDSVYSFRSGKPSELVAGMGKATAAGKPSGVGGRATVCALQGPTFCCHVGSSIVFAETAAGQLRLLTDIYPWVTKVMSVVYTWACSFEHTADAAAHTTSLADAVKATRALDELFSELHHQNYVVTGRRGADAQGPVGNVSACVRACVNGKIGFYERIGATLGALGVPADVARAVRAKVFGTPRNEKFFGTMRAMRGAASRSWRPARGARRAAPGRETPSRSGGRCRTSYSTCWRARRASTRR